MVKILRQNPSGQRPKFGMPFFAAIVHVSMMLRAEKGNDACAIVLNSAFFLEIGVEIGYLS